MSELILLFTFRTPQASHFHFQNTLERFCEYLGAKGTLGCKGIRGTK